MTADEMLAMRALEEKVEAVVRAARTKWMLFLRRIILRLPSQPLTPLENKALCKVLAKLPKALVGEVAELINLEDLITLPSDATEMLFDALCAGMVNSSYLAWAYARDPETQEKTKSFFQLLVGSGMPTADAIRSAMYLHFWHREPLFSILPKENTDGGSFTRQVVTCTLRIYRSAESGPNPHRPDLEWLTRRSLKDLMVAAVFGGSIEFAQESASLGSVFPSRFQRQATDEETETFFSQQRNELIHYEIADKGAQ